MNSVDNLLISIQSRANLYAGQLDRIEVVLSSFASDSEKVRQIKEILSSEQ